MLAMASCLVKVLQVYFVFVREHHDDSLECQRQGFRFKRNVQAQINLGFCARDLRWLGVYFLCVVVVPVRLPHPTARERFSVPL
jgi:hypothetical protein